MSYPKAPVPWGSVSIYRAMEVLHLNATRVRELYESGVLVRARRSEDGHIYWRDEADLAADCDDARRAHHTLNAQGVGWSVPWAGLQVRRR